MCFYRLIIFSSCIHVNLWLTTYLEILCYTVANPRKNELMKKDIILIDMEKYLSCFMYHLATS